MLRAGLFGAFAVALPLSLIIFAGIRNLSEASKRIESFEQKERESRYTTALVLNTDVYAGDIIKEDMVRQVTLGYSFDGGIAVSEKSDIAGGTAKVNMSSGTILTRDMVYIGLDQTDELRTVELSNIYMPMQVKANDFVDVRIAFPDGEDYIVTSKKRIYELLTEEDTVTGFIMRLTEDDILRIQSAAVDMSKYRDTRMYAVRYVGDHQSASTEFYPVNEQVYALIGWDPNIRDMSVIPGEEEKRVALEENIRKYLVEEDDTVDDKDEDKDKETYDSVYDSLEDIEIYG